jgi:PqqD family protein of HPr-rel-A system
MSDLRHLRELALSDTGFVFDPFSGATFTVNETGLCVLQAIKDGADRAGVTARLTERFELGGEDLARDIEEFVHLLRQHGLVPKDFEL